ncbi:hypothetical protein GN958_ATG08736 [Phytophthora infestans]|uniref:M96 mating-specific protein family n=1 Tax=Phytophthora infestans TaxID=4787 RepID=A0A8S9UMS0_PHYIN|nr:hypothetical protein GN958_ATG08736 [Phytophthora infestans]
MNSASLDETLDFLHEELPVQQPNTVVDGDTGGSPSLGSDVWDPEELLTSIDNEIVDFRAESTDSVTVTSSQSGNSASQDEQSATKPVKPKRKRKKQLNSNRARDERRYEVVRLRREAEDLELTLQQLKEIRSQQEHSTDTQHSRYEEEDTGEFPAVWQDICARQLNRRLKAEQENAKLKRRWDEDKRVVKSIENMLFKRMVLTGKAHPGASKHTRRTNLTAEYIKRVAAFIFDELSASVEVSYREVDGIFAENGPVPKNVVTHQPLLRGGIKGMYQRLFDERLVPFTLPETGDAWWKHWHNYREQQIQDATANVVTESFGLEMNDFKTNASATSYGQQILHRHVEENRIVFVWNAYIEPFVFEDQPVSGIYLLEQSHVLIKPVDPDSTAEDDKKDECFTSMSTCYVITPHFLDPKLKNDPKTKTLLEFLVSALSANIRKRNESVENLLLDQALQRHHCSL